MITTDGRLFEGTLECFDHSTNLVIAHTVEWIIHANEENESLPLGVYLLRGGSVVCVGEVDETQGLDWMSVKGDDLRGTKNPL